MFGSFMGSIAKGAAKGGKNIGRAMTGMGGKKSGGINTGPSGGAMNKFKSMMGPLNQTAQQFGGGGNKMQGALGSAGSAFGMMKPPPMSQPSFGPPPMPPPMSPMNMGGGGLEPVMNSNPGLVQGPSNMPPMPPMMGSPMGMGMGGMAGGMMGQPRDMGGQGIFDKYRQMLQSGRPMM